MAFQSGSRNWPAPGMLLGIFLLSACPVQDGSSQTAKAPTPHPRLGINLAGPADWNTELPFVDVFRFSRPWVSQKKGQPFGKGPKLELDAHGWITRLEPDCWAETPMCTIEGGHYPPGKYTVLYDGEGEIDALTAAKVASREPGRVTLDVQPTKGAIFLKVQSVNPANYPRNIRVIMPGFLDMYKDNPWNPAFLKRWEGMACVRFMDWMLTNGSKIVGWEQRPQLDDATFCERGVAAELMVDLCNRLKANAWFCMPHRADDDYVHRFAQLVKERLDPALKVYVEYSNEVWNGGFEQCRFAGEEGRKMGMAEKPWQAAWRYTAHRSIAMFKIWEQVFGKSSQIIRILPSQAANPGVSREVLEFREAYKEAQALAIAPYVSFSIPTEPRGQEPGADLVQSWSVDQLMDHLEKVSLPQSIEWMRGQKKVAQEFGLSLVAYEAGQHLVGISGAENNERLTKLLLAANAHPRMQDIYTRYLNAWADEGGDLLCHFSSVSHWTKWGSWGLLEYSDDDPAKSPKFVGTMRWAMTRGQKVAFPR